MKWRLVFLVGIVFFSFTNVKAEPLEPADLESADFPSLMSALKITTSLEFCNERVPMENQEVRERLEKELLLSLWDRPQVILWLKRSRRYLPYIEQMLRQHEMPGDLKYVAIAESALRPHVRSRKGAVGFWQFIKETGRKSGLVINGSIDERRSIFASTRAAIRHFQELYDTFGSWTLAAAAYNMGGEGLMAEILEQGNNNYYELYLPLETQRYVFRILSIKLILNHPERYGFYLSEDDYYPPLRFDLVQVKCFQDIPIRIIAQAAETNFKTIKDLNPEIRGHYLAKGNHTIMVPAGSSSNFQAQYQDLLKRWSSDQTERTYLVKAGDNLTAIADRFGVPLASLLIWNKLNLRTPIHPGDELIIYRKEPLPVESDNGVGNDNGRSFENN